MMSAGESTTIFTPRLLASGRDVQWSAARTLSPHTAAVVAKLRILAPYAAMLVLPGGSLLALLWWLYRRQRRAPLLPTRSAPRGWQARLAKRCAVAAGRLLAI
jgi:hypothetical protein